jgi:arsenite methyltransferase
MDQLRNDDIRQRVATQYSKVAEKQIASSGCSTNCCDSEGEQDAKLASMQLGYSKKEVDMIPEGANMGLGCGAPREFANIQKGENVLDLGSGGGFDCFLASADVGETGYVIGVDMTPTMVSKARNNLANSKFKNINFRLGEIEHLPVADDSIDVIISNCVINLSPDKKQVFKDAYRVLKKGGRLAISDIVATAVLPKHIKEDMALFTGCMAGASQINDIEKMLATAGFKNIKIKPKDKSREFIKHWAKNSKIEDFVVSATIEAVK